MSWPVSSAEAVFQLYLPSTIERALVEYMITKDTWCHSHVDLEITRVSIKRWLNGESVPSDLPQVVKRYIKTSEEGL